MKQLSCIISGKYREFEKCKILCLLEKALVISILYRRCKDEEIY